MLADFQIKKLTHLFHILDFDHNNLIEKTDFEGITENIEIFTGIVQETDRLLGLNEQGELVWQSIKDFFNDQEITSIDLHQWLGFMENHFYSPEEDVINANIKRLVNHIRNAFDKDHDLRISGLEFMCLFVSCRVEVRFAHKCFKTIDLDKDGFIDLDELYIAANQFFKSNDPNDSGNYLFGELGSTHFSTKKPLSF
ncbi:MAG: Ca2+-binding EF-hand superfamily protein [Cyclobacteriaceae bacterium]|jgi:Ca2+-binding EF-hand superfamily protein